MSIGVEPFLDPRPITGEDIERMNLYVSFETDEDIPYLANALGDQCLVTGTDFGHNDLGSELGAHQTILARSDISPDLAVNLVERNGRKLLDIDPSFCPAPQLPVTEVPNVEAAAGGPPIMVPTWVREQHAKEPVGAK
jgi:hypothetical protein